MRRSHRQPESSFLCLVCGYHPCYGHDQIRTGLGSDDARLEDVPSSQHDVHVHPAALVSWDAVWDLVLARNKHCTDMVRISSQKRAFEYARGIASGRLRDEFFRNPEANPEHLVEELGINPQFQAEALAELRWEMQMHALLDARG